MKLFKQNSILGILTLFLIAGCTPQQQESTTQQEPATDFTKAIAVIHPLDGDSPNGMVTFERDSAGIAISAEVSGLKAQSKHGFHIHEFGDCSADDGTSAGGHYAPDGSPHGEPGANSHDGDLGNVVTDENGEGSIKFTSNDIVLNGPKSIIGRGIIIHANADDMSTQPSGDAGSRIACGVIGIANTVQ